MLALGEGEELLLAEGLIDGDAEEHGVGCGSDTAIFKSISPS